MINVILEILLISSIDALLLMFMILGFNLKSLARDRLFLTWVILALFLWICPTVMLKIPLITQLFMCLGSSFIISKMFKLSFKECFIKSTILVFVFMLMVEVIWFIVGSLIYGSQIYNVFNIFQKFIYGLSARILELFLIYIYIKGVFYMGMFWFVGKEEVEVEDEETEE